MATSSSIDLSHSDKPEFSVPNLQPSAAQSASSLLQRNHQDFHIYFNNDGFHNHIGHHIMTLFALGADSKTLEKMFNANSGYQRPALKANPDIVRELADAKTFKEYLNDENHHADYQEFFSKEIEAKGWQNVLNEYLFARDERADDLLVRTFAGFLHPLIHLGFGVEFNQPAIIAEALAEACSHSNWIAPIYIDSEKAANKLRDQGTPSKSAMQLLQDIQGDEKLKASTHFPDSNKIRDGIMVRAPDEMIKHASQYYIKDASELEKRTAEMMHLVAYFTMAAQRPPKSVKVDFFYMHCVNSGIFFTKFMKADWLSPENKVRLLEWKIRGDLALYVSRNTPSLDIAEITNYSPKEQSSGDNPWPRIIERVVNYEDDGHASKLVRALAHSKDICPKYEGDPSLEFQIKGDLWDKAGHMAIDSVEIQKGPTWVRGAGFEEAWKEVPERNARL